MMACPEATLEVDPSGYEAGNESGPNGKSSWRQSWANGNTAKLLLC